MTLSQPPIQRLTPPDEWWRDVIEPALSDYHESLEAMAPAKFTVSVIDIGMSKVWDPATKPHRVFSGLILFYHFHERLFHYFEAASPEHLRGAANSNAYWKMILKKYRREDLDTLRQVANTVKHHVSPDTIWGKITSTTSDIGTEHYILVDGVKVRLETVVNAACDFYKLVMGDADLMDF